MCKFITNINSIDSVKRFCHLTSKCIGDVDAVSGHHIVDAKSIMGLFSLDLSKDIEIQVHTDSDIEYLKNAFKTEGLIFK